MIIIRGIKYKMYFINHSYVIDKPISKHDEHSSICSVKIIRNLMILFFYIILLMFALAEQSPITTNSNNLTKIQTQYSKYSVM